MWKENIKQINKAVEVNSRQIVHGAFLQVVLQLVLQVILPSYCDIIREHTYNNASDSYIAR